MTKVQAAKKVAVNLKVHNLIGRTQKVKKFLANLKNKKIMRKAQAVKKKANLKMEIQKKGNLKKKMNLKLWISRKRMNFQKHNGFIKFTCLKSWMELTKKLL